MMKSQNAFDKMMNPSLNMKIVFFQTILEYMSQYYTFSFVQFIAAQFCTFQYYIFFSYNLNYNKENLNFKTIIVRKKCIPDTNEHMVVFK